VLKVLKVSGFSVQVSAIKRKEYHPGQNDGSFKVSNLL
jgi:hypothetical protein